MHSLSVSCIPLAADSPDASSTAAPSLSRRSPPLSSSRATHAPWAGSKRSDTATRPAASMRSGASAAGAAASAPPGRSSAKSRVPNGCDTSSA
eukprot:3739564-Prymnesium_polylepis.1